MNLKLIRKWFTDTSTCGMLYVDDKFQCYTLEDVVRTGPKIRGETAIPYGTYDILITFSNRFQRDMPLLVNVPGFEGVRIHSGNTDKDTEGCLLLGMTHSENFIGSSRQAFENLFPLIDDAYSAGKKITLEITEGA